MKRKKIYSMLALGMAMSMVFAVPVSATGASSPTTTVPPEVTENPDGTTTTTTKTEGTDAEGNKVTTTEEVTTTESGETTKVVTTTVTEKENGKVEVKTEKDPISGAESTTTKETTIVGGEELVAKIELDNVLTSQDDLSEIMAEVVEKNDTKEVLKDTTLAVPDQLPDDADEEKLGKEVLDLFAAMTKAEDGKKKFSIVGSESDFGKMTISPVGTLAQTVAQKAADSMAQQVWGGTISTKLLAAANIELENHDGKTAVQVSIPFDNAQAENTNFTYFVMHFSKSSNSWERLPATVGKDGIIVAVFDSFSPVYVVAVPKDEIPETPGADDPEEENPGGNDSEEENRDNTTSSNSNNNSGKAGTTPAGTSVTPANPAVSPKTGE